MTLFAPLKVRLVGIPESLQPAIRYTLEEVATRLGVPVQLAQNNDLASPNIIYGNFKQTRRCIVIPFEPRCYESEAIFEPSGTPERWAPRGHSPEAPCDLLGGIFRLLALLDEKHVVESDRDRRGVFKVSALPQGRRSSIAVALVEHHIELIRKSLQRSGVLVDEVPRWPGRKKWAVLLTHDTDAVRISAGPEIIFNATKALVRCDPVRLHMAFRGLRNRCGKNELDPLWGFSDWRKATESLMCRSAFFLFVRRKVFPDINDCRSTVSDPRTDWKLLRNMADTGWEFGLHAPIKARKKLDEFIMGKSFLEERLQRPIFGLRHHYWALDWRNPHRTHRMHVNAGFRYDMSMAWRDAPGFRTGTCLPYRPWDPERQKALDIYSIPTALMDGHVIQESGDPETAFAKGIAILETVRQQGGVATLDWHTETALDDFVYKGHRRVAEMLLKRVQNMGDAWVTTPWDMLKHWHQRNRQLGFGYDISKQ